ncbi:hypothetical protein ACFVFJ_49740 [Streptomyces sp. NPDC057717]
MSKLSSPWPARAPQPSGHFCATAVATSQPHTLALDQIMNLR